MARSVLIGEWNVARKAMANFESALKNAVEKTLHEETLGLVKRIKKGIRDQSPGGESFEPLSELTMANRSFTGKGNRSKALIIDGDLIGSVTNRVKGDEAWVGVNKKKRTENGQSLSNIAAVHEFGFEPIVIPYTDKMRRYLMAMMSASGIEPQASSTGAKDVLIISIPARPFLRPSFKAWQKNLAKRWKSGIAFWMKDFGE